MRSEQKCLMNKAFVGHGAGGSVVGPTPRLPSNREATSHCSRHVRGLHAHVTGADLGLYLMPVLVLLSLMDDGSLGPSPLAAPPSNFVTQGGMFARRAWLPLH